MKSFFFTTIISVLILLFTTSPLLAKDKTMFLYSFSDVWQRAQAGEKLTEFNVCSETDLTATNLIGLGLDMISEFGFDGEKLTHNGVNKIFFSGEENSFKVMMLIDDQKRCGKMGKVLTMFVGKALYEGHPEWVKDILDIEKDDNYLLLNAYLSQ